MRTFLNHVVNPVVLTLLRSPLHGLLSRSVMLITVVGRRTGRSYTLPVQYVRRGVLVDVCSSGHRRWWHNLHEGRPVRVQIGNETIVGVGEILHGSAADGARATLAGTVLATARKRSPDGVIVRLRLDPAHRA